MKRLMRILKRIAWSIAIIGAIILMIRPAILAYEWIAWHVWTEQFKAVCKDPVELTGDDVDWLYRVDGPYTHEFWQALRVAYEQFPEDLPSDLADWREDGTLFVPKGFAFELAEDEVFFHTGDDRQPDERAFVLSLLASGNILRDREEKGTNLAPFNRYAYSRHIPSSPPILRGYTCGFMQELITVGGALATEDADAGERP